MFHILPVMDHSPKPSSYKASLEQWAKKRGEVTNLKTSPDSSDDKTSDL